MKKKIRTGIVLACVIGVGITVYCNQRITRQSESYIFSNPSQVPKQRVGVVLGTSAQLKSGETNLYFLYRIQAAAELYQSGKIEYLLVSGDNSTKTYNEPEDMKNALVALGVPAERIYLDYAGFRTLDSMVRAKEIFGQHAFVVISQPFHTQRAVFLAREKGIEAFGLNAQDVPSAYGYKTRIREWAARVWVFLDLYFHKQPRFGGQQIKIG